jgi:GTPase KRas protein
LDTAGQDEYTGLRDEYMRSCDGFLLVFDLTNKKTFEGMDEFRTQIMRSKDTNNPLIFIAANKCDMPESEKKVSKDDLEQLSKKWNVSFLETSAKEGRNVQDAFLGVIQLVLKKRKPVNGTTQPKEKKKCAIL